MVVHYGIYPVLHLYGQDFPVYLLQDKLKDVCTLIQFLLSFRLVKGKPKPTVRWFFQTPLGNKELNASGEGHIILYNVTTENSGTYRCEAHNYVGDDRHSTKIFVDCKYNTYSFHFSTYYEVVLETYVVESPLFETGH